MSFRNIRINIERFFDMTTNKTYILDQPFRTTSQLKIIQMNFKIMFCRKSETMVDAAVLEKLEAGFQKLQASDSKSLLKKYLTKEVFDNLKTKKTSFGSTLLDVVQSGKTTT